MKSAKQTKYEEQLYETVAAIDKAEGRIIRYAKKLEGLRARRKLLQRNLAKAMAEEQARQAAENQAIVKRTNALIEKAGM